MGTDFFGGGVRLFMEGQDFVVTMSFGLGMANLVQGGDRRLRVRTLSPALGAPGTLLLRNVREPVPIWMDFFSPRRIENLVETGIAGEVTDREIRLQWAQDNEAHFTTSRLSEGQWHWTGELQGTSGLWSPTYELGIDLIASRDGLRGRFGLPHPHWGQDVNLKGTLPGALMVTGAVLAGWLMFCEHGGG